MKKTNYSIYSLLFFIISVLFFFWFYQLKNTPYTSIVGKEKVGFIIDRQEFVEHISMFKKLNKVNYSGGFFPIAEKEEKLRNMDIKMGISLIFGTIFLIVAIVNSYRFFKNIQKNNKPNIK